MSKFGTGTHCIRLFAEYMSQSPSTSQNFLPGQSPLPGISSQRHNSSPTDPLTSTFVPNSYKDHGFDNQRSLYQTAWDILTKPAVYTSLACITGIAIGWTYHKYAIAQKKYDSLRSDYIENRKYTMYPNDALIEYNQSKRQLRNKLKHRAYHSNIDLNSALNDAQQEEEKNSDINNRNKNKNNKNNKRSKSEMKLSKYLNNDHNYFTAHLIELNDQLFKYNRENFKKMKLLLIPNSMNIEKTHENDAYSYQSNCRNDNQYSEHIRNTICDIKYLSHCQQAIQLFLGKNVKNICFIPFASV